MLLFSAETPPITSPLIQTVIELKVEEPVEKPKEYTIEEKVKLNVNNCNTDIQYIRADNAECLDKPVYTPPSTQRPVRTAVNASKAPSGWYPYGWCTYWVSTQRSVGQWNNASEWLWQARRDGWATGSTPRVGAIAWESGHVSYVTAVNGNQVTVSEMNYVGWGVVSTRTEPASNFQYIY
jgi:surface antigen